MKMRFKIAFGFVVSSLAFSNAPAAQAPTGDLLAFLQKHIGLSDSELEDIGAGRAVARMLKTSDQREIAAFGIVRVKAGKDVFLPKFRDIVNFKKSPSVLQIGKFSPTPSLSDLQSLTLDDEDIEDLKRCGAGDCDVKLPANVIERLRNEIASSEPDYKERANSFFRRMLFDYLKTYLVKGNASLAQYNDKKEPVSLAEEFRSLLDDSPYLFEAAPEFHKYLVDYPKSQPPNTENFVYWSKEKWGLKPVISLTHVTIYKQTSSGAASILIASKQIYASHYFDGSLGLTSVVEDRLAASPALFLAYLNRSRVDALRGGFNRIKRSMVGGEIRDALEKNLRLTRDRLEAVTPRGRS